MNKRDFSDIGNDIKKAVQEALNSADLQELNKTIKNSVGLALEEAKKSIKKSQEELSAKGTAQKEFYREKIKETQNSVGSALEEAKKSIKKNQEEVSAKEAAQKKLYREKVKETQKPQLKKENSSAKEVKIKPLNTKSPKGRTAGVLFTVFGYIDVGLILTLLFPMGIIGLVDTDLSIFATAFGITFPFLIAGLVMVIRGSVLRARVRRFREYARQLNGRTFCAVKELASRIKKSTKFIVKDLRKMIEKEMIPEGQLNENESYLLINHYAKESFDKFQKGLQLEKEVQDQAQAEKEHRKMMEEGDPLLKEVNALIKEEEKTLTRIREANDAIPGAIITKKLDRLERILRKIFQYMKKNPERIVEFRKFTSYYLPTTLKLVNAYWELDSQPIQGDTIKISKNEIEGTLDTINQAFETLLDSFFEDYAMDISTDISVLENMLTQEGLVEKDFN